MALTFGSAMAMPQNQQVGVGGSIGSGAVMDYLSGYASVGAQAKRVRVTCQGDSSYPTGGYSITPANLGLTSTILQLQIINETDGAFAYAGQIGIASGGGSAKLALLTPRSNSAGTQAQVANLTSVTS